MKPTTKHLRNSERKNPEKAWLRTARGNAKRRKQEFTIELGHILGKIPEVCPVLGVPLQLGGDKNYEPSLDRIDNSKGYVPGNIIIVSRRANRLKSDASADELAKLAEYYSKKSRS